MAWGWENCQLILILGWTIILNLNLQVQNIQSTSFSYNILQKCELQEGVGVGDWQEHFWLSYFFNLQTAL